MAKTFTITRESVSKTFTVSTGVGPTGSAASVTNANVNSAIETDAAATRTSLGLGTAALSATGDFATAAQGTTADGAAQKSANLSDLTSASTARTNLGLGTAAVANTGDFATSAQGAKADAALPKAGGTMTGGLTITGGSDALALYGGSVVHTNSFTGTAIGFSFPSDGGSHSQAYPSASGTIALTSNITGTNSGTNTGDQTSIVGITGTTAQFNTALLDGDFATLAGTETLTNKTLTNPTVNNYTEGVVSIGNSGTTQTLALTSGTFQTVTLTGNCTFTMPTATAGKSFILKVLTGAGGFTGTFTSVKWANATTPTVTAAASKYDLFSFVADGSAWSGSVIQNYTA